MQKYQILDIIDEGAYGIVWKALNKETQQFVAIKQFKQNDDDESNKKTIQRQIKMLKMLKSDYVVGIKQAFKKKGKIYLIFQYFPKNLLNVIEVYNSGLEANLIKQAIYKIVKCLKYLHNKNIIHRDIKPENILLSQQNSKLKLCDLGFARFMPQNPKQMTDYVATRWYRSPQLLVGEPYGKPSDIFAVGCIIGELADAQPMFPGQNQVDQIFLLKKYVGELTPVQHRCLFENHKFSGAEIPHATKKQSLDERYLGKMQKNCLLFMKACLRMNPSQRITAEQALKHPYLIDLSMQDKEFDNDEQNLLNDQRKTVPIPKTIPNLRASVSSLLQYQEQQKIQQSLILGKNKSSQKKNHLKSNFGSLDFGSLTRQDDMNRVAKAQKKLIKKSSYHQLKVNDHSPENLLKISKTMKNGLLKNMSQQKHLKLNLDLNVSINLINKRSDKLPQLKQSKGPSTQGFDFASRFGLGNRNNLSIHGHTKEMSNQLLSRKLGNLGQ